jgi:hypothetical protein|tara:strand:+ start:6592 stop:7020 length:429 start_codon:yes stop_codon:yes gene_type:complete
MKLTLPKKNMTKKNYKSMTRQVCVIPNSEENRKAIKHLNTLAKEQHSEYRFSFKYRCPKKGSYGRYGEVAKDNADGLGLYVQGASYSEAKEEIDKLNARFWALQQDLNDEKEKNNKLWRKYLGLKQLIREKEAINQKIKELL